MKLENIEELKNGYLNLVIEIGEFAKNLSVLHLKKIDEVFVEYMKQKYKLRDLVNQLDNGRFSSHFKKLETKLQIIETNIAKSIRDSNKKVKRNSDSDDYQISRYVKATYQEILTFRNLVDSSFEGSEENLDALFKILQLLEENRFSEIGSQLKVLKPESLLILNEFEELYYDYKKNEMNFTFAIFAKEKIRQDSNNLRFEVSKISEKYTSIFSDQLGLINLVYQYINGSNVSVINGKSINDDRVTLWFVIFMLNRLEIKRSFNSFGLFIDEAQDIGIPEYRTLRKFLPGTFFELYGDPKQFTQQIGDFNWNEVGLDKAITDKLNQNYRNPNQITEYINKSLRLEMVPIGIESGKVIEGNINDLFLFIKNNLYEIKHSRSVCITKSFSCVPDDIGVLQDLLSLNYGSLEDGNLNILTINDIKGLEFEYVIVVDKDMTVAERYVSYSRSLNTLFILRNESCNHFEPMN